MRLADKVAIITGAGSGIGEATATLFAAEGAKVVVADINGDSAGAVTGAIQGSGGVAMSYQADVSRAEAVESLVKAAVGEFGRLDVMFNNAGIGASGNLLEVKEEIWERAMDVNLKGTLYGCKFAVLQMIQNGGGAIINSASVWALVGGSISCVYPVTKAGVIGLSKHMALAYAPHHIRVNWVLPGHIETPLISRRFTDPEAKEKLIKEYPIGRLGRPIDVANAVLFLASEEASFITGTGLVIDGGYTAK